MDSVVFIRSLLGHFDRGGGLEDHGGDAIHITLTGRGDHTSAEVGLLHQLHGLEGLEALSKKFKNFQKLAFRNLSFPT